VRTWSLAGCALPRSETGKRLANNAQAVNLLAHRPITNFRCGQIL
jgi:hypothetical protein